MYEQKDSYLGPKVTAENDPRITPFGRILRQTKLNELPQLWNVLIGDMSLVGPRPEDPTIAAEWPEDVRREVFTVKPGITSPASVVYRNEEDLLQSASLMETYLWDILPSKLRLDQIYVRNRSVLTDLDVILWTTIALVPRLKSFDVPEHLLYWGPLSRFTYQYLGWFLVDFVVSFLAVATSGVIRRLTDPLDLGLQVAVGIALLIAILFGLINALAGLNRLDWTKARAQDAVDLGFSTGIVTIAILVASLVFSSSTRFPISVIIISGVLSYMGFVTVRYRTRLLTGFARYWLKLRGKSMKPLGERVLIVGAGEVARFATWLLSNENLAQAFTIIGMVDDDPRKVGTKIDDSMVIGTTNAIPDLVRKYDIGLVFFAIADIQPEEQDRILSLCQATPARITPIPDIIDSLRAQFPKNDYEREIHFNKVLRNATMDKLTGACNRPHFMKLASVEYTRSKRYGHPLSLVAIGIDYVRPRKASYANMVASQIMQSAARRALECIRGIDLLGRYDETVLLVMLPETDEEAAALVAQRLKDQITKNIVDTNRGPIQTIAEISCVTSSQAEGLEFEEMLAQCLAPILSDNKSAEVVALSNSEFK